MSEEKLKITKDIVVFYHRNCTDGFSSAWVAWKQFGNKADYFGIDPGIGPELELIGKDVYMLDLIYPAQYLEKIISDNKKVIAIDHHVSNGPAFEIVKNGLFNIENSGAVLSWSYFFPEKSVPTLLKHVEDMDLWKFQLPNTKEIISALGMVNFSFDNWTTIAADLENESKYGEYLKKGSLILEHEDHLIERIIENNSVLVDFLGYQAYAVNSPVFNSQIANILCQKKPPMGIVWSQESLGNVHVSLRSDGAVDVSELASRFTGGGGHKKSAGFSVKDISEIPWKKI